MLFLFKSNCWLDNIISFSDREFFPFWCHSLNKSMKSCAAYYLDARILYFSLVVLLQYIKPFRNRLFVCTVWLQHSVMTTYLSTSCSIPARYYNKMLLFFRRLRLPLPVRWQLVPRWKGLQGYHPWTQLCSAQEAQRYIPVRLFRSLESPELLSDLISDSAAVLLIICCLLIEHWIMHHFTG